MIVVAAFCPLRVAKALFDLIDSHDFDARDAAMTIAELLPLRARRRAPVQSRRSVRHSSRRSMTPRVESLESLCLMATDVLNLAVAQPAIATTSLTATTPTFPSTPSSVTSPTNLNATVNLPGFDTSLGTLTSVTIAAAGSINGQISSKNNSVIPATITGSFSGGTVSLSTTSNPNLSTLNLAPTQTTQTVQPGQSLTFNVTPSNTGTVVLTDATSLAAFSGAAVQVPILFTSQGNVTVSSSSGLSPATVTNTATASVTVTYIYELPPASLSGYVYYDANDNGLRESGDFGLGGITVTLTGTNDLGPITPITTTTNYTDGSYSFTGLRPGTYTVTEPPPEPTGFLQGLNTRGNVTPLPLNTAVDQIDTITVPSGGSAVENDFGKILPASVSGFVYVDANKDGLRTSGETGLGGITVVLTGTDDTGTITPITMTTSFTDGSYDFTGLRPGTYIVTEPPPEPAGYIQGQNTRGNITPLPFDSTVDQITAIAVGAGGTAVENDFGKLVILPPPGAGGSALSGFVFDDTNNPDGIKEVGEPGLGSVIVTLTGTDEFGRSVSSTLTTNTDGSYFFGGLYGGTYTVTEGTSPTNFHHGLTSTNNIVIPNSFGTGLIPNVALPDNVTLPNNNFAELRDTSPQVPCGPLFVTNLQRYGVHNQPTELVLTFNEPLAAATATNPANYQLRALRNNGTPFGAPIAIQSIVYNSTNNTVVLILAAPLNVHYHYQLTVNGLTDNCGDVLQGNGTTPGTPYVTTVSRTALAGFLNNQGQLVTVNNGQFPPGTYSQVPGVNKGSAASNAGYPVQVGARAAAAAAKAAAAKALAIAKAAAAKAHAVQVAATRAALRHKA